MIDAKSLKRMYYFVDYFFHNEKKVIVFRLKKPDYDFVFYFAEEDGYVLCPEKLQVKFTEKYKMES